MRGAPKICAAVVALATLLSLRPASSATAAARREPGRGALAAGLPAAVPRSVFLPREESRLLAMTNHERSLRGLTPVYMTVSLREAARTHAREMALWGYIGHTSRYGLGVRDRMAQYLRPGSHVGENLAFVQTIEQAHAAFVESRAHRQNILNPAFRRVGIGVATMGDAGIMIAEDFTDSAGPRP